jgi:SAM-dependent methyltransferase
MKHKEYKKLHAEWYELMSDRIDHSKEIDFWSRCIEESGEPVLELGSGTGRIFIPLLEQGFEIVGLDTSEDMMARCFARCQAKGLKAELHEQSMLAFDLYRDFGLIFLDSGGLGLFTSDDAIHATFKSVMTHLKPGGLFVFEFQPVPPEVGEKTQANTEVKWGGDSWNGDWLKGSGDAIIAWRLRRKYDPATHIWEMLFIIEKFINGTLVETEVNERTGKFFTVNEAVQYARAAGFKDIRASDWLTEDPPGDNSKVITVRCKKPAGRAI